jgi:predicted RNA-binding Zn-ribbon protein involved in translation (DUF1610 family)
MSEELDEVQDGIECPNCEDGTEMVKSQKDSKYYYCPKCGYGEPR